MVILIRVQSYKKLSEIQVIIPLKFGQSKKNTDICPRYETSEGHQDREMASRITKEEEK
jgi:hypothetical protein